MFIKVRLLNGFQKTLTYKIPDNWGDKNLVDTLVDKIVCVPIKNRELAAIVLQQFGILSEQEKKFEIREVIRRIFS